MTNYGGMEREPIDIHGLDELLGAYALDAVDEVERARVDDYLSINPRAAMEVAEHREVATMLAYTGMGAPERIWDRIERELDASERAPEPGPELARVLEPRRPEQRARWARPVAWAGGVAAALIVGVVAVGVLDDASGTESDPVQSAFESTLDDATSLRADLVAEGSDSAATGVLGQDGLGFVDASTLPRLDGDLTYQLWGVLADTGDVVSMGILGPDPTLETFTIDGDVDALAITIERIPGVISDGNPDGAYVGAFG